MNSCSDDRRITSPSMLWWLLFLGVAALASFASSSAATAEGPPHAVGHGDAAAGRPLVMLESVRPADRGPQAARYGITRRDLEAIGEMLPEIVTAVPIRWQQQEVRRGGEVVTARLVGTTADYQRLHEIDLASGRFLSAADTDRLRNVAVLSSRVARQLFGTSDAVGQSVRVGRQAFTVVGVLATRDAEMPHDVYLPLATMRARLGDTVVTQTAGAFEVERYEISRLELELARASDLAETTAVVTQLLEQVHDDDSIRVTNTLQHLRSAEPPLSPPGTRR